jgi:uroporphyrinogen decarboxylase
MNSRERVRLALEHREPDRVPIDLGGTFLTSAPPAMQQQIADRLGLRGAPDPRFGHFDDRIQRHFGCDLRSITPKRWPAWGFDVLALQFPLKDASLEDLATYPWPEPDPAAIEGLEEEARFLHEETDYFICASQIGQGLFELGCYMRGYERILLDIALDPGFVHRFNEKALATNIRWGDLYFGVVGPYVDMVLIGDDLATQRGLYMSPSAFRELYKPYFAEYVASIRRLCPRAKIAHHCCGSSFALLDDLVEIGIDVINPVQTRAAHMSPEALATKKDQLAFLGGVDLQRILPYGTHEEVEAFVKTLIEHLAPGGGYILAACHSLPEDVKPENVITMLEAALRWGRYPLEGS